MRERESMRMKNLFSSPSKTPDLQNFSLSLEITKKMIRELRDDNADIKRRLTRIIAIIQDNDSATVEREEEYPEEEIGTNKDNPRGN